MLLVNLINHGGGEKHGLSKPLLKSFSLVTATAIGCISIATSATEASFSFTTPPGSTPQNPILPTPTPGSTPQNPILPTPTPGVPGFRFPNVSVVAGRTFFFDPDVAVGYDYAVTGGPLFSSVLIPAPLPQGDSDFLLELGGFGNFPLVAGTPFDLLSVNPLGFSNFRISGIDTNELLDPTNPVAFVTGLEFTTAGTVNVTQTPIIQNVPDPVRTPEPSGIIGLGILGGGLVVRRLAKRR
jgi:hypothetical protein